MPRKRRGSHNTQNCSLYKIDFTKKYLSNYLDANDDLK